MVDAAPEIIETPRGRGRPKNGAPLENSLWRLEEIIRRAAVRHERLPPVSEIADEMQLSSDATAYHLLNLGMKKGLWRIIRRRIGFLEVLAGDSSWRTASYDEWLTKTQKPRKCLGCGVIFTPPGRYRFQCNPCAAR